MNYIMKMIGSPTQSLSLNPIMKIMIMVYEYGIIWYNIYI